MKIKLEPKSDVAIYQQIIDRISENIQSGALAAGSKLPTVRELAQEAGIANGTVKHAYDLLEQMGLVEKIQGSGTFVCDTAVSQTGKKQQAMIAIDSLLDKMQALSFSMRDIRILIELKLREREHSERALRVGVIECCPETLHILGREVGQTSNVDVYEYPLSRVLESGARLSQGLDIIVTTATHYEQVLECVGGEQPVFRVAMVTPAETVSALARIKEGATVGVLTKSERFSGIVKASCLKYCTHAKIISGLFDSEEDVPAVLGQADVLVLPEGYLRYVPREAQERLRGFRGSIDTYSYGVDKGSALFLSDMLERLKKENQNDL